MGKQATIETNRGTIQIKLHDAECPGTVANFEKLAKEGFYDGQKWHRVIPDFMIQGGCPFSKSGKGTPGTGDPGYRIDCELTSRLKHAKGVLSMAHAGSCKHDAAGNKISGSCSNGSQFFITHTATPHLDGVHTVFGQVTSGQNVVDAIKKDDEIRSVKVETV